MPAAFGRRCEVFLSATRGKKPLVPRVKRYSLFSSGQLAMKIEDEENTGLNLSLSFSSYFLITSGFRNPRNRE